MAKIAAKSSARMMTRCHVAMNITIFDFHLIFGSKAGNLIADSLEAENVADAFFSRWLPRSRLSCMRRTEQQLLIKI